LTANELITSFSNGEEVPRAYVVSTTNITENDVMEWMKKRVSKTKYLRGGVEFIDAIPKNTVRTPTQKATAEI
jgi:hypothetical protein